MQTFDPNQPNPVQPLPNQQIPPQQMFAEQQTTSQQAPVSSTQQYNQQSSASSPQPPYQDSSPQPTGSPQQTQQNIPPQHEGMSQDTKTIIVIILLVTVYPIGLIFMYMWMKWPIWVKLIVSSFVIFFVLGIMATIALSALDPKGALEKADDTIRFTDIQAISNAAENYYQYENSYPESVSDLVGEYLAEMPIDPSTEAGYQYTVSNDGQSFSVCAQYVTDIHEEAGNPSCIESNDKNDIN